MRRGEDYETNRVGGATATTGHKTTRKDEAQRGRTADQTRMLEKSSSLARFLLLPSPPIATLLASIVLSTIKPRSQPFSVRRVSTSFSRIATRSRSSLAVISSACSRCFFLTRKRAVGDGTRVSTRRRKRKVKRAHRKRQCSSCACPPRPPSC